MQFAHLVPRTRFRALDCDSPKYKQILIPSKLGPVMTPILYQLKHEGVNLKINIALIYLAFEPPGLLLQTKFGLDGFAELSQTVLQVF